MNLNVPCLRNLITNGSLFMEGYEKMEMRTRFFKCETHANFAAVVKTVFSLIFVALVAPSLRAADDSLLKSQPPVVIKTFPVSGYDAVDPETKFIKVIFNKKMTPKSWSFVQIDKKHFRN